MIWGLVSAHQVDAAGEGGDEVVEPPPALEKKLGVIFFFAQIGGLKVPFPWESDLHS